MAFRRERVGLLAASLDAARGRWQWPFTPAPTRASFAAAARPLLPAGRVWTQGPPSPLSPAEADGCSLGATETAAAAGVSKPQAAAYRIVPSAPATTDGRRIALY